MKRFLIFLLLLFPGLAFAQPAIVFDEDVYDFGEVDSGQTLKHTFGFSNAGNETLIINSVTSSWGCTAVVASSSHLEPGEKGSIEARVDMTAKQGMIVKTINVKSNDPLRPLSALVIRARAKMPPNSMTRGQTQQGQ